MSGAMVLLTGQEIKSASPALPSGKSVRGRKFLEGVLVLLQRTLLSEGY
jgi:hypothetical protein